MTPNVSRAARRALCTVTFSCLLCAGEETEPGWGDIGDLPSCPTCSEGAPEPACLQGGPVIMGGLGFRTATKQWHVWGREGGGQPAAFTQTAGFLGLSANEGLPSSSGCSLAHWLLGQLLESQPLPLEGGGCPPPPSLCASPLGHPPTRPLLWLFCAQRAPLEMLCLPTWYGRGWQAAWKGRWGGSSGPALRREPASAFPGIGIPGRRQPGGAGTDGLASRLRAYSCHSSRWAGKVSRLLGPPRVHRRSLENRSRPGQSLKGIGAGAQVSGGMFSSAAIWGKVG